MGQYSITVEIPTAATDSNRILGQNKFLKHSIFKKVKRDIAILVKGKEPEEPLERFLITVTRHGVKTLDYDNFIASLKPFIDGLTLSKIIKNDSWKFIKYISVNQVLDKQKKLVIQVEESA